MFCRWFTRSGYVLFCTLYDYYLFIVLAHCSQMSIESRLNCCHIFSSCVDFLDRSLLQVLCVWFKWGADVASREWEQVLRCLMRFPSEGSTGCTARRLQSGKSMAKWKTKIIDCKGCRLPSDLFLFCLFYFISFCLTLLSFLVEKKFEGGDIMKDGNLLSEGRNIKGEGGRGETRVLEEWNNVEFMKFRW